MVAFPNRWGEEVSFRDLLDRDGVSLLRTAKDIEARFAALGQGHQHRAKDAFDTMKRGARLKNHDDGEVVFNRGLAMLYDYCDDVRIWVKL